ncbi:MAG: hypothetical protein KAW41_04410 [Candidatus Diapherotrites archaeon]|nr:hypothetical protein [Candidatus Diapherotrites archaeon]
MGFLQSVLSSGMGTMGGVCAFIPYCELVILGLKIVMLLFIIGWVRGHLGGGLVATIVMLFIGYLALFQYFYVFGPLTIVYLLIIMGIGGAITDLAFGGGHYGVGPEARAGDQRGVLARMQTGEV